jgi:hypothetical protein
MKIALPIELWRDLRFGQPVNNSDRLGPFGDDDIILASFIPSVGKLSAGRFTSFGDYAQLEPCGVADYHW